MTYRSFSSQYLENGWCNKIKLTDGNLAIYNGLSYWCKIFSPINGDEYNGVELVTTLYSEDDCNFTLFDLIAQGYTPCDED